MPKANGPSFTQSVKRVTYLDVHSMYYILIDCSLYIRISNTYGVQIKYFSNSIVNLMLNSVIWN